MVIWAALQFAIRVPFETVLHGEAHTCWAITKFFLFVSKCAGQWPADVFGADLPPV